MRGPEGAPRGLPCVNVGPEACQALRQPHPPLLAELLDELDASVSDWVGWAVRQAGDKPCVASLIMSSSVSTGLGILVMALLTAGCGEPCERVIKVKKVVNTRSDTKVEVQTAARVGQLPWKFNRGVWEAASGNERVFPADEVAVRAIEDCLGIER